jgi:hypothetical protein
MRVDSLRPLMDGVPAHRAACGMAISRVRACAFLLAQSRMTQSPDLRPEQAGCSIGGRAVATQVRRLGIALGIRREGLFSRNRTSG